MDFFEAQARAKKRTSRLVALFALAVAGTVAASYFAAVFGLHQTQGYRSHRSSRYSDQAYADDSSPSLRLWQPQLFVGVTLGTLAIVGLASLYKWNEFSAGGSAVAESVGGRRVDPHTTDTAERRLLNVVEEMAIASGVPVPAVYVLPDEPAINAFAAGLTTSDAVVAVTRGTMQKLTRDELQGVIGHEFSHILNGDMRLNMRLTAIVFGILVLGLAGRGILWSLRGARFNTRGKNGGGVIAAIVVVGVALLIIGYVGYFFGRLIQAGVSRQREFLADASSVQFTRNPGGLTGALKKIGGYALGSSLDTHNAAAIGHFFFAQAFASQFGGAWATHPPLDQRIRAIDPRFDGKMFDPPEVVDVAHESFVAAGLAPAQPVHHFAPPTAPVLGASAAAVAAIGTISPAAVANAQLLLDATPARLRTATRTPNEAAILLYGLLLDDTDSTVRAKQRALVASRAGADALRTLDELDVDLRALRPEHRLPLLQIALPALRQLPPTALSPFLDTLDELVHADGRVTIFEFALQKLLLRTLALGRDPSRAGVVQFYSFNAVTAEISVVLSAVAHASSNLDLDARAAFAAGAAQVKLIETQLTFLDESASDLAALDAALDKLAAASGPIKQRTLTAAAHIVGADGQILIAEAELLRAISAALDVPMPPLATAA
jgi:Zn-dependent protease with chaperone function